MPNDLSDRWPQLRLSAILQYFQRGDFATFCKVCELAFGRELATTQYFSANCLLAAQVCGLCEVSTESSTDRWWVAHDGDVSVLSQKSKEIGMTPEWFRRYGDRASPLVTDSSGRSLLFGLRADAEDSRTRSGVFAMPFDRLVPPFKDAQKQVLAEASYLDNLEGNVDAFSPERGVWEQLTNRISKQPQLLRVHKVYSGVTYFVQHPDLAIRIKVVQPEWAFIAAYFLLPWKPSSILSIERDTVRIARSVRLPTLMYRSLFAGADSLCIGPTITFERVDADSICGAMNYLRQAGDRQ
jgi:hypothetical protein